MRSTAPMLSVTAGLKCIVITQHHYSRAEQSRTNVMKRKLSWFTFNFSWMTFCLLTNESSWSFNNFKFSFLIFSTKCDSSSDLMEVRSSALEPICPNFQPNSSTIHLFQIFVIWEKLHDLVLIPYWKSLCSPWHMM